MNRPVLVTGGTGFVGRALVRELLAHGRQVHVLRRAAAGHESSPDERIHWHEGDLGRPATVHAAAAAVARVAAVAGAGPELVHAAAVISYRAADRELQRRVNVEGTRTVLAAAQRFGYERAVHVSSVVTIGYAERHETLDEDSPFNAGHLGVDYVDTKRRAEEVALGFDGAMQVVVVNPGAVFGSDSSPGARESNTARFLRSIGRGEASPLAPPGGLSVVGLRDTARGIRLALERGTAGRRYILVESYLPALDVFQKAARAYGVSPVRATVPRSLWPAVVRGARLAERLGRVELATAQALRLLGLELRFSGARARAELDWHPQPFDRVLWETVDHLRSEG